MMNPRRTALWLLTFGLFFSSGLAAAEQAPAAVETVTGRVFLDANANGQLDPGEKGLAGVAVTDSVGFVITGQDGSYKITIADDPMIPFKPSRVVSVSWPSGKWPTGAWWKRLSEIKAGQAVNFGLRDDEQKLPVIFAHVTDDHGSGGMYPAFGKEVEKMGDCVKLCFNTGDMGYASMENADEMFSSIAKNAKAVPVPMFFTPGNHDFVTPSDGRWGKQHPLAGHGGFTKYLGPIRWSFDYAGVHFFGVDWLSRAGGKIQEGTPPVAAGWLERDLGRLKPGTQVIGFVHFPFGDAGFFAVMRKHKVVHVLAGHTHQQGSYRSGGIAETTTINLHGNGGCTLGIAGPNGFDLVSRCAGCKAGQPEYHSRLCALRQLDFQLIPALKPRRGAHMAVARKTLNSASEAIDLGQAKAIEIDAQIEPGTARKVGLRIGTDRPLEIAFSGKVLAVAGVEIPFSLQPGEKALKWHVVVEKNSLTIYANSLLRLEKAVDAGGLHAVTLFADGGAADFKKVDLWELKGKP